MEQATNQFTKGLQMDINPMVQGNDTLTDCLNGTLITQNGNEVILQNDMGNRRVDNAFLPPGYQPVGIKEFGGIIYVAAYNPITNKSQIGSFPSPERKMDINDDLFGEFDFSQFFDENNKVKDDDLGIDVLKSDSFLIPLTKDTSLHAGDKFAVYANTLSSSLDQITNYNNIYDNKAKTPKNRRFTLQLGVLNSQNEFIDITKTLCRWKKIGNKWEPITENSEKSEVFKFNDNYFIPDTFSIPDFSETLSDAKLIKERQKIAANTYAYKLIGPLYLKSSLNHIENFNYNVYGLRNNNNTELWVEGYLNYNCPDGYSDNMVGSDRNSNENYATFDEGIPEFDGFDFIDDNSEENIILTEEVNNNFPIKEKSIYNPNSNIYSTKIVRKYIINNKTSGTYNYIIGVLSDKDEPNLYLKGLSVKGQLDLGLLGSGKVFVNGWKFYNNLQKKSTVLTFSFNAYPKYGESFNNLRFNFKDIKRLNEENYTGINYPKEGGLPLYNGRQTYDINWDEIGFEPRKVYKVEITFDSTSQSNQYPEDEPQIGTKSARWFMTTELFNDYYNSKNDFSKDISETDPKFDITVYADGEISNTSILSSTFEGGLISINPNIEYKCTNNYQVNLNSKAQIKILNEELYPDFVNVNGNENKLQILEVNIKSLGNNESVGNDYNQAFKQQLNIIGQPSRFDQQEVMFSMNITPNNKTASGNITFNDLYKAYSDNHISNISNGFSFLSDIIDEAAPADGYYGGVRTNYNSDEHEGDYYGDTHFIDVIRYRECLTNELPHDAEIEDKAIRVRESKDIKDFQFNKIAEEVYDIFNHSLNSPGQMFYYAFQGGNDPSEQFYSKKKTGEYSSQYIAGGEIISGEDDCPGKNFTRVWWRTASGDWATFKDLFNYPKANHNGDDHIQLKEFIESQLGKDYIYCMYPYYSYPESGNNIIFLYATNDNFAYYDEYNIPLVLNVTHSLTEENPLSDDNISFGLDLRFKYETFQNNNNLITFNLKSSEEFHNTVRTFDADNISNVELSTGLQTDSNGNKLNSNNLYYKENNKLIKVSDRNFLVDTENLINGKNTLVYNKMYYSTPSFRYLRSRKPSDSGTHTILDFYSVNIITS